jgi:hypothetical protein
LRLRSRQLALVSIVLAAVLLAVSLADVGHRHTSASDQFCRICQTTHAPSLTAQASELPNPLSLVARQAVVESPAAPVAPLLSSHSSRAPPACA